mmetsp:Transcript_9963/g.27909  ORF Transcript_9963/g.27909 Transcript_9963/m.27909 type:complete len:88 (-) Transcript_9963:142-405(-)
MASQLFKSSLFCHEDLPKCFGGVEGGERGATCEFPDRLIGQLPAAEYSQRAELGERGQELEAFVRELLAVSDVEVGEGWAAGGEGLN